MGRLIIGCAALILLLASCGGAPDQGNVETSLARDRETAQALESCREDWPGAPSVARARCQNERERAVLAKHGARNMDLFNLLFAYRLAVAERYEADRISGTLAELNVAELERRITREQQRRQLARDQMLHQAMQAAKARAEAYTRLLDGLGIWGAGAGEVPAEIICDDFGGTVECR